MIWYGEHANVAKELTNLVWRRKMDCESCDGECIQ
jgi:hypothetical protein